MGKGLGNLFDNSGAVKQVAGDSISVATRRGAGGDDEGCHGGKAGGGNLCGTALCEAGREVGAVLTAAAFGRHRLRAGVRHKAAEAEAPQEAFGRQEEVDGLDEQAHGQCQRGVGERGEEEGPAHCCRHGYGQEQEVALQHPCAEVVGGPHGGRGCCCSKGLVDAAALLVPECLELVEEAVGLAVVRRRLRHEVHRIGFLIHHIVC